MPFVPVRHRGDRYVGRTACQSLPRGGTRPLWKGAFNSQSLLRDSRDAVENLPVLFLVTSCRRAPGARVPAGSQARAEGFREAGRRTPQGCRQRLRKVRLGPAFLCSPGLGRQGWTHGRSEGRAGASAEVAAWSMARARNRQTGPGAQTSEPPAELIPEPCPPCPLASPAVTEHWLA